MAVKIARKAELYVSATSFNGTPADLAAMTTKAAAVGTAKLSRAREHTVNLQTDTFEISDRSTTVNKIHSIDLADGTITATVNADTSDAGNDILSAAWEDKDIIAVVATDGPIGTVGTEVVGGDFFVSNRTTNAPSGGDAVNYSVELKPASGLKIATVTE